MTGAEPRPRTLVVGYDGSPAATAAARWAVANAGRDGRVVVVSAPHDAELVFGRSVSRASVERARARLEALWMEDAALVDADAEWLVPGSPPAEALCQVAAERDADEIVIGIHREGHFRPDVVRKVLEHAGRPVVVVPG